MTNPDFYPFHLTFGCIFWCITCCLVNCQLVHRATAALCWARPAVGSVVVVGKTKTKINHARFIPRKHVKATHRSTIHLVNLLLIFFKAVDACPRQEENLNFPTMWNQTCWKAPNGNKFCWVVKRTTWKNCLCLLSSEIICIWIVNCVKKNQKKNRNHVIFYCTSLQT